MAKERILGPEKWKKPAFCIFGDAKVITAERQEIYVKQVIKLGVPAGLADSALTAYLEAHNNAAVTPA